MKYKYVSKQSIMLLHTTLVKFPCEQILETSKICTVTDLLIDC